LTKKDDIPLLSLTIINTGSLSSAPHTAFGGPSTQFNNGTSHEDRETSIDFTGGARDRETIITQDVPVRVLSTANVEGIHEPRCREPDVHILLPPLMQLKSISDRFTKLALASRPNGMTTVGPRLELAANMHGCLKISTKTDAMNISSVWTGLSNPELDPGIVEGGEDGIREHPSTRMKALGAADGRSEEGWAKVRIDGRDWGKVMSVGRLGGRVIACRSFPEIRMIDVLISFQVSATTTLSSSMSTFQMKAKTMNQCSL
jgi:HUS1 checkpoint protein